MKGHPRPSGRLAHPSLPGIATCMTRPMELRGVGGRTGAFGLNGWRMHAAAARARPTLSSQG